jgi:hypothetical protein
MSRLTGKNGLVVLASGLVVLAFGFPRAGQASILEEMMGELRLRAPVCSAPFVAFDSAPFGSFHLVPEGAGGTVSFTVGGDSLTATEIATNRVRRVDPLSGRPIEATAPPEASCPTGIEADCWVPGEPTAINANAFDAMCAPTKGYATLDDEACAFTIYNSQNLWLPTSPLSPTIAVTFGVVISGQDPDAAFPVQSTGGAAFLGLAPYGPDAQDQVRATTDGHPFAGGARTPLAPLVVDPNDGPAAVPSSPNGGSRRL